MEKTPGQIAYEKWLETAGGWPPIWDNLSSFQKDRWEIIAQAAIKHFLDSHTCGADPAEPTCINCP